MRIDRSAVAESGRRWVLVCVAFALAATGCGYDLSADEAGRPAGGRDAKVDWSTDEDVASRLHIVPIARTAIEQRFVHAKISDVACASTHMYVSAGAVTDCTATINDVASGWTLTFRDATGSSTLVRRPGAPWRFTTPE